MSERLRDVLTVVVIVALLLLAFWGVLALRRGRAESQPRGTAPGSPVAGPGRAATSPGAPPVPPKAVPVANAQKVARPETPPPAEPGAKEETASAAEAAWTKRLPLDFTSEELAQCGGGVRIDLGTYAPGVGSEFDVAVRLVSPALESCSFVVQYDPEALAVLPDSARPVGPAFRGGIEAYDAPVGGKLVIIHSGLPGKKNIEAAGSGPVVAWRMRALRVGVTQLLLLPESSFTSGRGVDETYDVLGGEVSIR